jgi:hypothetical protein
MIRVTWYFMNGNTSHESDYETPEQAFEALELTKMEALAKPTNTTCGCYVWNPSKDHTLEGFIAKLAICCNDPREYSENLIKAGICAPYLYRSTY